jgi:ABC-type multidrug transport system fused ATPase/permease subunit
MEIAGIGTLGSFIAVIADPLVIQSHRLLSWVYKIGNFQTERGFLVFFGVFVFLLIFLATASKMLALYIMQRYIGNRRYSLGLRLFKQYLYQPYHFFLDRNSGELGSKILSEVDMIVSQVLSPVMDIVVRGVLIFATIIFLVILNPVVAILSIIMFGSACLMLYITIRARINHFGKDVAESNRMRYKAVSEAFGGIKDVKILGNEPFFVQAYHISAKRFAKTQTVSNILSLIPGQAIQVFGVGFAIMLILILSAGGTLVNILPMLSVYAFAIMRMMPNIQGVFSGVTQIKYFSYVVESVYTDMTSPSPLTDSKFCEDTHPSANLVHFTKEIVLDNIIFSYPASREPVLNGINLCLEKNMTIGLVGTTGCGKTTLVDIIMGLLGPIGGEILVDNIPVREDNFAAWRHNFGYVPQQIYLSDDTLMANIAFGIPAEIRNEEAVEKASRIANLHEFVSAELPDGYDTIVGERGVRLSGGQRQRIGIARALYHDPPILIMDEATSALDSVTEDVVMDAIHNLMHSKTIIIIAHRISTVKECKRIYLMEKGYIIAQGTYDELLQTSSQFRALAKALDKK